METLTPRPNLNYLRKKTGIDGFSTAAAFDQLCAELEKYTNPLTSRPDREEAARLAGVPLDGSTQDAYNALVEEAKRLKREYDAKEVEWDVVEEESEEMKQEILDEVTEIIQNGISDTVLALETKRIRTMPEDLGLMANLKELNLSGNKLESLPMEIANLSNLRTINISNNNMGVFPEAICGVFSLERLYANKNQFSYLPNSARNLMNLRELYLMENKLKDFPPCLTSLFTLTDLFLNDNEIEEVPAWITKLRNLETLAIRFNPLERLPVALNEMNSLKNKSASVGDEIVRDFYVGAHDCQANINFLRAAKITHIVLLGEVEPLYPGEFTYLSINIPDDIQQNIAKYFNETYTFIDNAREEGACLVVCSSGVSRSGALAMAYVMRYRGLSPEKALELCQRKRPSIQPNDGFLIQLRGFNERLLKARAREESLLAAEREKTAQSIRKTPDDDSMNMFTMY